MKALQLVNTIPRYALTKVLGAVYRPAYWGPLSLLRYQETPQPALPGPDWVKVKTRYGGICGSDLHTICLESSLALSVFTSFPFVLGHENVGTIAEVGAAVKGLSVGDRVVVEPVLSCVPRGIAEPCPYCQRGETSLCQNFTAGNVAPGFGIGNCRDTGGSWGPYFVAHQSQVFPLPATVSDENGVMLEPFCSAAHAVLQNFPDDSDTVLVLGAGVIGLCVVATLRAAGSRANVIVVARYPFQAEMARQFGADEVIDPHQGNVLESVAKVTGGRLLQPILGEKVLVGGANLVYECVGSSHSINDSLRLAGSGGRVVLVGLAAVPKGVDWTPIWLKELTVKGSFWCSTETFQGRHVPTMQLALEWLAAGKLDLSRLVTHRFRLDDYRQALAVTTHKGRYGVIKTVFVFDGEDAGSK